MFKQGDLVIVNPQYDPNGRFAGRVFCVRKVNPTTYACDGADGGQGLKAQHSAVIKAPDDAESSQVIVRHVPLTIFHAGEIITVRGSSSKWTYATDEKFVVLGTTTAERLKVAKLGGDVNGRTWTVPKSSCKHV